MHIHLKFNQLWQKIWVLRNKEYFFRLLKAFRVQNLSIMEMEENQVTL